MSELPEDAKFLEDIRYERELARDAGVFTEGDMARLLGKSVDWVKRARKQGIMPQHVTCGGKVFYANREVRGWFIDRTFEAKAGRGPANDAEREEVV